VRKTITRLLDDADRCEELREELFALGDRFLQVEQERDEARGNALVLRHAYESDNRPPRWVLDRVAKYPVDSTKETGDG